MMIDDIQEEPNDDDDNDDEINVRIENLIIMLEMMTVRQFDEHLFDLNENSITLKRQQRQNFTLLLTSLEQVSCFFLFLLLLPLVCFSLSCR